MGTKSPWASTPPDYAVPPGDTVLELIESLGISQSEFAERTGRPKKTINEIIKGKAAITPETALQFERVLGVPANMFNSLEQQYRAALARISEREKLQAQTDWLNEIPVRALVKAGWIPDRKGKVEQLEAVLSFYGVASPDAWNSVWADVRGTVAFRESSAFVSDFGAVTAWLRKGEIEARGVKAVSFDTAAFKSCLTEARALTTEPPETFCDRLIQLCAAAGVVVRFIPELPKLRVWGATRWLSPDRALIQLSLRYKSDDHLWFTFFHEAGHILLHGKKAVFVESDTQRASGSNVLAEEEQANQFARDFLIPRERYVAFTRAGDFGGVAVQRFARELGIAPGIIVGRLQHEKRIPFNSTLNRLKRFFKWAEEE